MKETAIEATHNGFAVENQISNENSRSSKYGNDVSNHMIRIERWKEFKCEKATVIEGS